MRTKTRDTVRQPARKRRAHAHVSVCVCVYIYVGGERCNEKHTTKRIVAVLLRWCAFTDLYYTIPYHTSQKTTPGAHQKTRVPHCPNA